jgi:hypothetical protein
MAANDQDEEQAPAVPGTAAPARPRSPLAGLVVCLLVAGVLVGGAWALLGTQTSRSPGGTQVARRLGTAVVDGRVLPHVALSFSTYPFAGGTSGGVPVHPGGNGTWPTVGPTSDFQVPAHALVTVTVRQYDGGAALDDPWLATVQGTVGGVATVDGRVVHSVDPDQVAHTFLLRSLPGAPSPFLVNVPLPDVPGTGYADDGTHRVIVFSFVSGPRGTYVWNCEFPCGQMVARFGSAMSTLGYMSGYVHVT